MFNKKRRNNTVKLSLEGISLFEIKSLTVNCLLHDLQNWPYG